MATKSNKITDLTPVDYDNIRSEIEKASIRYMQ